MFEEVVGGAGTVDPDQDFPAVARRDLLDPVGEDPDVVTDRVGPGVAFSQQHGQRFGGVRAPCPQRVEAHGPGVVPA
jgi:hypothetical protein